MNVVTKNVKMSLEDTNDPIASRTSWSSLSESSATFKTKKIRREKDKIFIENSTGLIVFSSLFVIIGAVTLVPGVAALLSFEFSLAIFLLVFGAIFCFAGIYILRAQKNFVVDLVSGCYFYGKQFDSVGILPRSQQGRLGEIHAIQLLNKYIRGDTDSPSYYNYEINLVFKDAERIHIMCNAHLDDTEACALLLGEALNVPIWKGV